MAAQRFAGAGTLGFRLLQPLAQLFVEIAVAAQHFRRVGIAEMRPTFDNFSQSKSLLARVALHLLRPCIVFF
ncbi:Uncharacterised protein [Salmonella enterica subsp. enterica serovar Typhi]|nr:Uncharacterised protein [Salmonella enterica subsp. enterica serovar Typhi]CQF13866.1 Uncharacterised protein [Salmonella enterica subsp. enterica serovar Typhimurium str. DT104]